MFVSEGDGALRGCVCDLGQRMLRKWWIARTITRRSNGFQVSGPILITQVISLRTDLFTVRCFNSLKAT